MLEMLHETLEAMLGKAVKKRPQ